MLTTHLEAPFAYRGRFIKSNRGNGVKYDIAYSSVFGIIGCLRILLIKFSLDT